MCESKAPARTLTDHAQASILQKGRAATELELAGVVGGSHNAARHVDRAIRKFGLALPVPISEHPYTEDGQTLTLPYIKPYDYLRCLLLHHPDLLFGGHTMVEASAGLQAFWNRFEAEQPSHAVFGDRSRLKCTVPYSLHGDGGRTQKKQPLDIISLEPTLGLDSKKLHDKRCCCPRPCSCSPPWVNSKHNSYLSRFLLVAFPAKEWPAGLLDDVFRLLSHQLRDIFAEGICCRGKRFYFACLGMKGDLEFHVRSLRSSQLQRSYETLSTKKSLKMCLECHAGAENMPFEDCNRSASWVSTTFASLPWVSRPPMADIPFENWESLPSRAASFFRRDPFHIFRLGTAWLQLSIKCWLHKSYGILWGFN